MCKIYGDILDAANRATQAFEETEALLEYPEVQADKAYYVSVLSRYNELKFVKDKADALQKAILDEREATALLSERLSDEDREAVYGEISALKREQYVLAGALSDALGLKHAAQRAYCKFLFSAKASDLGVKFCAQIKEYLRFVGAKIEGEQCAKAKEGYVRSISFFVEGEDVLTRLSLLAGAHKAYVFNAKSEEVCFAVAPASQEEKISEKDVKINLFHSGGAGGQNVNKVETAVRVTHIPTGTVVVCQDERSQLANKKRALETLEKRLEDMWETAEKRRIDADVAAQFCKKNTPISFDLDASTMTDSRLKNFVAAAFPLKDFAAYMNGLLAL